MKIEKYISDKLSGIVLKPKLMGPLDYLLLRTGRVVASRKNAAIGSVLLACYARVIVLLSAP